MAFSFVLDQDNRSAKAIFTVRSCMTGCALLGIIGPIIFMFSGEEIETDAWQTDAVWYVQHRDWEGPYVCQTIQDQPCDEMWSTHSEGFQRRCYKVFTWLRTWSGAQEDCQLRGGSLAVIPSAEANTVVHSACGEHQPCWIGLKEENSTGEWQWFNGSSLTFTNWAQSEPSDSGRAFDRAVLGQSGVLHQQRERDMRLFGSIFGIGTVLCTVGVFCGMCWGFYCCAKEKNDCCLICSGVCDTLCIGASVLGLLGALASMADSFQPASLVDLLSRLLFVGLLIFVLAKTMMLRGRIVAEKESMPPQDAVVAQMVVGQPVVGQPVVGQMVVGQPVAAQQV